MADLLTLSGATIGYRQPLIQGAKLTLRGGTITVVLGPNGSGKTALLNSLSCQVPLLAGELALMGSPAHTLGPRDIALRVAVVPQFEEPVFDYTVREIVEMGRLVHLRGLWPSQADHEAIGEALEATELHSLQNTSFLRLSGGEKQRVLIARALAQQAPILLLDEPTNHLDTEHFGQLRELLQQIGQRSDRVVLLCTHELDFAAQLATEFYAIQAGTLIPKPNQEPMEAWVKRAVGLSWQRIVSEQGADRWIRDYRIADSSSNH